MEFHIRGLEAHAGICPEKGISAIKKVAAEGIAGMQLGRIDHETTANIEGIEGGMAVNIVSNSVVLRGEARSHSEENWSLPDAICCSVCTRRPAGARLEVDGKRFQAKVEAKVDRDYDHMHVPDDSAIVRLVQRAAKKSRSRIEDPRHWGAAVTPTC